MTRTNVYIKLNKLTTKADVGVSTTKGRGDMHKYHIKYLETPKGD